MDQDVGLTYTPAVNETGGNGALSIARPDTVSVHKNNKGQYVIGTVRNGWGMKTADTVTNDSPAGWIALALKTELDWAGYDVTLVESLSNSESKALKPSVDRVWVDHDMGFWTVGAAAEVSFRVKVMKYGQVADVIAVREEACPRSMVGGSASQKGQALQSAIQAAMHPVDSDERDRVNWLANATISTELRACNARHVLVVADSCYSGKLTRSLQVVAKESNYYQKLARRKASVAISSGGLEPVMDSGGKGKHSVFSSAFLDFLQDNTSALDALSLFNHIRQKVSWNADQMPEYGVIHMVVLT